MSDAERNALRSEDVNADLVRELLKDRRRDRRWRNLRFFAGFIVLVIVLYHALAFKPGEMEGLPGDSTDYVALIRLNGMIAPQGAVSAAEVVPQLREAFADKAAKGVVIDINSGGGTPVQAAIIHDEIVKLKKKYNKRVVIVGEDLMASGAYYIAVSGDKIYVNPNTITGSIGVLMEGFGANNAIQKIGVERRVITAGDHKDRLDPFLPQNPEDVQKIQAVIAEVHQNFSQAVLDGRQGKLQGDQHELFSGDFWSGQSAIKLGLVDSLGNLWDAMQTEFQVSRYKDYGSSGSMLHTLANQLGSALNLPLPLEKVRLSATL